MNVIFFMLPAAVAMAGLFSWIFLRAVRDGQFDDLDDPPRRMLRDD